MTKMRGKWRGPYLTLAPAITSRQPQCGTNWGTPSHHSLWVQPSHQGERGKAPQDTSSPYCFDFSHTARMPSAQNTLGTSAPCLPWFLPNHHVASCEEYPRTRWLVLTLDLVVLSRQPMCGEPDYSLACTTSTLTVWPGCHLCRDTQDCLGLHPLQLQPSHHIVPSTEYPETPQPMTATALTSQSNQAIQSTQMMTIHKIIPSSLGDIAILPNS